MFESIEEAIEVCGEEEVETFIDNWDWRESEDMILKEGETE